MTDLVTAEEAALSLRLGGDLDETDSADLAMAIAQASAIYLDYHPEVDWGDTSPETSPILIPDNIKAAVLLLLHAIWDNRGEDPLAKAHNLMRLNRGPAVA